jgi:hypothetical protein
LFDGAGVTVPEIRLRRSTETLQSKAENGWRTTASFLERLYSPYMDSKLSGDRIAPIVARRTIEFEIEKRS